MFLPFHSASAPVENTGACECVRTKRDGVLDLRLKFRRAEIVAVMGPVSSGEQRVLTLSGLLRDGTPFQANDCVTIRIGDIDLPQPQEGASESERRQKPRPPDSLLGPRADSRRAGGGLTIGQIYPNPFNPQTVITYSVPSTRRVELVIYDVHGRVVQKLVDRQEAAGEYSVTWHGVDKSGSPVASGVYFVRLLSGTARQTRKIILLK